LKLKKETRNKMKSTTKSYLKQFIHPQWGSVLGSEKDIRIAVLKDEVELLEHAEGLDYAVLTRLNSRIEKLSSE